MIIIRNIVSRPIVAMEMLPHGVDSVDGMRIPSPETIVKSDVIERHEHQEEGPHSIHISFAIPDPVVL